MMKIYLRLMLGAVVILQSTVAQQPVGAPPSEWDISGAGDASIQGFTTDISSNLGDTVRFKIDTDAAIAGSTFIALATTAATGP